MNINQLYQLAAQDPATYACLAACRELTVEEQHRLASGIPTTEDVQRLNELTAQHACRLTGRDTQQAYEQLRDDITGRQRSRHPGMIQDIAWVAMQERMQAAQPPPPWLASTDTPELPPGPSWGHQIWIKMRAAVWWGAGFLIIAVICLAAQATIAGAVFIILGLSIPILALMGTSIYEGTHEGLQRHRAWLAGKPPSQRENIKRAETAAAAAAATAAMVGMRHHSREMNQRTSQSAIHGGNLRRKP